jgi:phage shock protein PspC (stress-responsive transcriptional regulator)
MAATAAAEKAKSSTGAKIRESLLRRKYIVPFMLACIILACNQLTGINSIIGYNSTILIQAGLSDLHAHFANTLFTLINFVVTIGGVMLVDRRGRKFLLTLGSAGIILSLLGTGILFHKTEAQRRDVRDAVQALVTTNQTLTLVFDPAMATRLLDGKSFRDRPATLVVLYSYGGFHGATTAIRSDAPTAKPVEITREKCVPPNQVMAFFSNPLAPLDAARTAPLKIENALITPVPSEQNGWLTAICLFVFMSFFAIGPGICVWLALSELMPTRIRSNGMSIALLINQAVSTAIAAVFLPTVGKYGYATLFFAFAGFTVIYFITAAFFLPETKGKTLEEIEAHFEGGRKTE